MGVAREPPPVKVVVAVLAAGPELLADAVAALAEEMGAVELCSAGEPWSWSRYYAAEMGENLWRQFAALEELVPSTALVERKEAANRLEGRWREGGDRRVNLDPGYVDVDKVVLASTKGAAHRLHLGRGIHAECALRFENGRFQPWSFTYPDYRTPSALAFFTRVRRRLKEQRRAGAGTGRAGR